MRIESGTTLTELLIATAIVLVVSLQASTYSSRLALAMMKFQHRIKLEDEMRSMQHIFTENIGRTDYLAHDHNTPIAFYSPSGTQSTSLSFGQFTTESKNSCVLFSSDKNENGVLDATSAENHGYRLRTNAIEYRVKSKTCNQTGWQDITDSHSTLVTALHFTVKQSSSWGTLLEITIEAQDATYPDITQTKVFSVGLANVRG